MMKTAQDIEQAALVFLREEVDDEEEVDEEPEIEEPQEPDIDGGDISTWDGEHWFQQGRLWLQTDPDWTWEETAKALQAQMDEDEFWPNVWIISDHGNCHLVEWPKPPEPDRDEKFIDQAFDEAVEQPGGYAGFDADYLNSRQPLPKRARSVYHTEHQPWAMRYARQMRDKYGINAWVDGTVTRGWDIMVHGSDADRAGRMFASVVSDRWPEPK